MPNKPQISIPTPCHENWQDMTVANRGRFCASCQKNVIDFTQSSDRLIAETFKKEGDVCGRFLKSQLERDLIIPKEKNRLWMAASAAVVAFLGLGNGKVFAQTVKTETVQVEKDKEVNPVAYLGGYRIINGTVLDETGVGLPGVYINIVGTNKQAQTDVEGKFSVESETGNIFEFNIIGFETQRIIIDTTTDSINITMKIYYDFIGDVEIIQKRNFAGRVLYNIGNIFRKRDN